MSSYKIEYYKTMAYLNIDISGRLGLVERHQGDLNDVESNPLYRYLGQDGQFAEGLFNPLKLYGYLSPANNTFKNLTGLGINIINSFSYDAEADILYASEEAEKIFKLNSLADESFAEYLKIADGSAIKDSLIYEMNGKKALVYLIDSNKRLEFFDPELRGGDDRTNINVGGQYVGFSALDPDTGTFGSDYEVSKIIEFPSVFHQVTRVGTDPADTSLKLAQNFTITDDTLYNRDLSGVSLRLIRSKEMTAGSELKVSLRPSALPTDPGFSDKGFWANATDYIVNDLVQIASFGLHIRFRCIQDHTSSNSNRPSEGADWKDYWEFFFEPSKTTELASATISTEKIPVYIGEPTLSGGFSPAGISGVERTHFDFGQIISDLPDRMYWITVEEVAPVMSSTEWVAWSSTFDPLAEDGLFPDSRAKLIEHSSTEWKNTAPKDLSHTRDFQIVLNRKDDWSLTLASGFFGVDTGKDGFLHLAESGLLYWFSERDVHILDGSITGGSRGRANKDALQFPSYINVVDVAETRGKMFIGIQSSDMSGKSDDRYYPAKEAGVFIWDGRSSLNSMTDYYTCPGAKEIKKVFKSANGDVRLITVSNSGFAEIRVLSDNEFRVIHTFELDGFPVSRKAVSYLDGMAVWLGVNGTFYAYGSIVTGEEEQLYKIGSMESIAQDDLETGAIFVGNENASSPRSALLFGFKDKTSGTEAVHVAKWYPHGDKTINGAEQKAHKGDIYTKVYEFGTPVHVQNFQVYFPPITGGDKEETVVTLKCHLNKGQTTQTWQVTANELAKGFFYGVIGEKNIFSIQFELEYPDKTISGTDFTPQRILVQYNEAVEKKK